MIDIDTKVLTQQFSQLAKLKEVKISDTVSLYLDESDEKSTHLEVYSDKSFENDSSVIIMINIFKENIYDSETNIYRYWHRFKRPLDFDTVIKIRKNNVEITVIEETRKIRSNNAQLYLEEVLNYMKN